MGSYFGQQYLVTLLHIDLQLIHLVQILILKKLDNLSVVKLIRLQHQSFQRAFQVIDHIQTSELQGIRVYLDILYLRAVFDHSLEKGIRYEAGVQGKAIDRRAGVCHGQVYQIGAASNFYSFDINSLLQKQSQEILILFVFFRQDTNRQLCRLYDINVFLSPLEVRTPQGWEFEVVKLKLMPCICPVYDVLEKMTSAGKRQLIRFSQICRQVIKCSPQVKRKLIVFLDIQLHYLQNLPTQANPPLSYFQTSAWHEGTINQQMYLFDISIFIASSPIQSDFNMAQVKLFIPGLANPASLFQLLAPHTALLSLALPEDQNQETTEVLNESFKSCLPRQLSWKKISERVTKTAITIREKIKSLRFAMDDDNDYESSQEKGNNFIHALQLEQDWEWSDVQTVQSEGVSSWEQNVSDYSLANSIIDEYQIPRSQQ